MTIVLSCVQSNGFIYICFWHRKGVDILVASCEEPGMNILATHRCALALQLHKIMCTILRDSRCIEELIERRARAQQVGCSDPALFPTTVWHPSELLLGAMLKFASRFHLGSFLPRKLVTCCNCRLSMQSSCHGPWHHSSEVISTAWTLEAWSANEY